MCHHLGVTTAKISVSSWHPQHHPRISMSARCHWTLFIPNRITIRATLILKRSLLSSNLAVEKTDRSMGSLMSGWGSTLEAPPLSVEEELKLRQSPLGKNSLTRKSLEAQPALERRSSDLSDERLGFLMRFAEKQQEERKSTLGRKGSGGLHGYSDKSSQVTVHVKGQRGTSLVFDMDPSSPFSPMADEVEVEGEEEVEGSLGNSKDKWWKKLPSSALNEERQHVHSDTGPSSFVPQFNLSGDNPYVKGVDSNED